MASYASDEEDFLSGGNPKYAKGKGENSDLYWSAVDKTLSSAKPGSKPAPGGAGYGAPGMPNEPTEPYRGQKLQEDLGSTFYQGLAEQYGIKKLDSANDLGYLIKMAGGGKTSNADPAKATQAVKAAVGWKDQNSGQGGSAAGMFGRPSGFVPGGRSYAADLAGDDVQRNSLYDNIAARGAGMVDSFRSVGRDYYMRANQEGKDISQAGWDALNALSSDVKPVDYINPWTTPVGKKGETLVAMSRDLING